MNRRFRVCGAVLLAACSSLQDVGGVVAIEVTAPASPIIEVHETTQLSARALNGDGDSIAAPIVWSVADTTVSVDPSTGLVTGVAPGIGRVFASVGTLSSGVVTFNVLAPADTITITDDSIVTVTADQPESDGLKVELASLSPPGVLSGRPVVFTITSPDPAAATPTVAFANGLTADTVTTA
ncbi:MAG: Ig-like domain-containing protein, partial [Gemmatimonadales bacterium]